MSILYHSLEFSYEYVKQNKYKYSPYIAIIVYWLTALAQASCQVMSWIIHGGVKHNRISQQGSQVGSNDRYTVITPVTETPLKITKVLCAPTWNLVSYQCHYIYDVTVQFCYKTVSFLNTSHDRQPITALTGEWWVVYQDNYWEKLFYRLTKQNWKIW